MSDFIQTIQCDEVSGPTQEDWAEFAEYCEEMDRLEAEAEMTAEMSLTELIDYFFPLVKN